MDGWIKLHRSITEHWIWQDSVKLKWWLDILLVANHTSVKVNIGMQLYDCHRGQTIMSLSNWAKRWGVSRDTARNFLVLLEKDKMILHENIGKSTRITICNYDTYQGSTQNVHESYTNNTHISDCYSETCVDDLHNSQTQNQHKPNANRTMSATNNNDKKEKNVNNDNNRDKAETAKRFTPPSIDEVQSYVSEKNYSVDAESFVAFYQSKNWFVGKNKMKDWHAAVVTWEKRNKNFPTKKQTTTKNVNDIWK